MNEFERSLAFLPSQSDIAAVKALPSERLPKISVVIPSFNQARFLPETLDSVLSQDYPRIEVFVSDGGSTDGSVRILEVYANKYRDVLHYVSEFDGGQYHGVNKGIEATNGGLIAWINSDDIYLPGTFWKVVTFFHFNRCALVAYGRNRYTDEHLVPKMDYPVDWSPVLREQQRRMMHFCLPPQPSLFFRRAAVVLAGKLASPILDYELWLRWQQDIQFYFIDDYLSASRLHADAKTMHMRNELIHGICKVVHEYYHTVPYSWALSRAYNEANGNSWASPHAPPVTRWVKWKAGYYWLLYNVRWAPRVMLGALRTFVRSVRESLYGRV